MDFCCIICLSCCDVSIYVYCIIRCLYGVYYYIIDSLRVGFAVVRMYTRQAAAEHDGRSTRFHAQTC